jgi:hypothetical protein
MLHVFAVALVVIMFELTGALKYILPYMIAAAVAKWCVCLLQYSDIRVPTMCCISQTQPVDLLLCVMQGC